MSINFAQLLKDFEIMAANVDAQITSIGKLGASASSAAMPAMFLLQTKMNVLSTFGTTLTSVLQGIQDIGMSIARNTKGS